MILSQSSVLELEPDLVSMLTPPDSSTISDQSSGAASDVVKALASALPTSTTLEEVERGHIVAVLNQTQGVVEGPRGAAKILGLHPNTLRHRMQKLGLKRTAYHQS